MAVSDYDPEAYEALTSEGRGSDAFDRALSGANVETLLRALNYAYREFLDDHLVIEPIERALSLRFGFTPDDIQANAEGREPVSETARAALGLAPTFLCPDPKASHGERPAHATSSAMETTTSTPTSAITLRDPKSLALHPCLDGMPELASDDTKFQALVADVRDRGFDYPAIIDEQDRVIDGRHRRRIALLLNLELPTVRRAGAEASEIILSTLLQRRHYSKGALAYMAAPLFAEVVEASRARRIANLQAGADPRKPTQSVIGKTVEKLAEELGFSLDLYTQAKKVRELFEDTEEYEWPGLERPTTVRRYFEPQILSGEIGLGGVIQACAGKFSTEGKTKVTPHVAVLFERGLQSFTKRFELKWEKLTPEDRRPIVKSVASEVTKWPEDVRQAALTALREAAKHKDSEPAY